MTQNNCVRDVVACDAGNRYIKWINASNQYRSLLSCVWKLDKYDSYEVQANCRHSVYLEPPGGNRYVIGQDASLNGGRNTFDDDKCEIAEIIALVALEPMTSESNLVVNKLRLCLPDSRSDASRNALQRLVGSRTFKRNERTVQVDVKNVQAVDETVGTFRKAKIEKLWRKPDALNGVISLGGKDGIARLYTPSGQINRNADVKLTGTLELVSLINKALGVEMGKLVKPHVIMNAIEKGDYLIPGNDFDFSQIFFDCRDKWWRDIRSAVIKQWGAFVDEIGEVYVVGGSANIIRNKLPNDRYIVPANPEYFDLIGLL
jgi:hypothetical protein